MTSEAKIGNLLGMARTAELGGNTQEAISYYNRVLEVDPTVYEAWIGKGKAAGWQSTLVNIRLAEMAVAFTNAVGSAPAEQKSDITRQVTDEANKIIVSLYTLARNHMVQFAALDNIWPDYIGQIGIILETMEQVRAWSPDDRNTLDNIIYFCKDNIEGYSFRDSLNNNAPVLHCVTPQYEHILRNKMNEAVENLRLVDPSYSPPNIEKESADACFVVTATVGDFDHPSVTLLRRFRDEWVLRQPGGAWLVRVYYRIGPHLARMIGSRSSLRRLSYLPIVSPAASIARRLLSK